MDSRFCPFFLLLLALTMFRQAESESTLVHWPGLGRYKLQSGLCHFTDCERLHHAHIEWEWRRRLQRCPIRGVGAGVEAYRSGDPGQSDRRSHPADPCHLLSDSSDLPRLFRSNGYGQRRVIGHLWHRDFALKCSPTLNTLSAPLPTGRL